jgi:uncharacterized protein DUF1942
MRKWTKITTTSAGALAVAAAGFGGAAGASAAPMMAQFGTAQPLNDGLAVSEYTVEDLKPSNDVVNVPVSGQLYEANVTVDAKQGTVTPAIPFFNARADNGQNYRVLFEAPAPEAISGMPLTQGNESTGKIYFDVTGAKPTTVAYNDAVTDRLVWSA